MGNVFAKIRASLLITVFGLQAYRLLLRAARIDDIDVALDCHYDFQLISFLNETFFR